MRNEDQKLVLVIEDDPNTANLVELYLEREGFEALQANDGEKGLALARKHGPDLVILDLMLPRLDGWEVCRRLRKNSDVPVIMLTARGEEIDRVSDPSARVNWSPGSKLCSGAQRPRAHRQPNCWSMPMYRWIERSGALPPREARSP